MPQYKSVNSPNYQGAKKMKIRDLSKEQLKKEKIPMLRDPLNHPDKKIEPDYIWMMIQKGIQRSIMFLEKELEGVPGQTRKVLLKQLEACVHEICHKVSDPRPGVEHNLNLVCAKICAIMTLANSFRYGVSDNKD